jgi:hypothetical protein
MAGPERNMGMLLNERPLHHTARNRVWLEIVQVALDLPTRHTKNPPEPTERSAGGCARGMCTGCHPGSTDDRRPSSNSPRRQTSPTGVDPPRERLEHLRREVLQITPDRGQLPAQHTRSTTQPV